MRVWQKASQEGLSPAEWDDLLRPWQACVDAPSVGMLLRGAAETAERSH